MKPIRWSQHARDNLRDREIARDTAEAILAKPEFEVADEPPRRARMGRYRDVVLDQEMLLRIIVEETETELVVITLYKTSKIDKYLKGLLP